MVDLTAQLQLKFGVAPQKATFALEVDERDALENRPIQVKPEFVFNWNWAKEEFAAFYRDKDILKVTANGQQIVRLYAPDGVDAELRATQFPVATNATYLARLNLAVIEPEDVPTVAAAFNKASTSFEDVTRIAPVTLTQLTAPRPAPPAIEYVGIDEQPFEEILEFDSERVKFQRYSYAARGFTTLAVTSFVTDTGKRISPPVWVPALGGAFVLSEPATGSIAISYPVRFRKYRVNYGMANGIELPDVQLAWLRGDITQCPMPPVKVFAVARNAGSIARAQFAIDVYPRGAHLSNWNFTGFEQAQNPETANLFTESGRTTQTVRVPNPDDDSQFIDIAVPTQITTVDPQGKPYTTRYQIPNA